MAQQNSGNKSRRFGCLQVLGIVAVAILVSSIATFFLVKTYLFPSAFKPVVLTSAEEKALTAKIEGLDSSGSGNGLKGSDTHSGKINAVPPETGGLLKAEPYSEKGLKREVVFTERELNGLLAKNTDLADKLAIDLSDDLISAKLRLPMDEAFPVLGGKILSLRSGVEFSFKNGKPVVILKGVTVIGIPVPNAWIGGIKNMDLVETFGSEAGFWKTFSDGIEDIKISEGLLRVKLKE